MSALAAFITGITGQCGVAQVADSNYTLKC
jgi:hypothetical protein